MDFIDALRIVYDLADANQLDEDEANQLDEFMEQYDEQQEALTIINDVLEGRDSHGVVMPSTGT